MLSLIEKHRKAREGDRYLLELDTDKTHKPALVAEAAERVSTVRSMMDKLNKGAKHATS